MNRLALISFLLLLSSWGWSQQRLEPRAYEWNNRFIHFINAKDTIYHQGYSPQEVSAKTWKEFRDLDREMSNRSIKDAWWFRKVRDESLVEIEGDDFFIGGDVLFNVQAGRDFAVDSLRILSTNTRGARVYGNIGKHIYFESTLHENQSFFPKFLSDSIRAYRVVPGQGVPKKFGETGFDYAFVTGLVNFHLNQHFNFQFGHDKLFIGHGYRSVLLSDNGFNFPFLKATATFWKNKLQYQTVWAQLQTLDRVPRTGDNEPFYIRKGGSFHYLSFAPSSKIEIGLFEGITWQRWNSAEGTMDFDYSFLNPVIFANTLIQQGQEKYDTLTVNSIGINARVNPTSQFMLYGQLAKQNNKNVNWQLGFSTHHLLLKDLTFRAEYNEAVTSSNYLEHYGQPMAHVSRGFYNEWLLEANYRYNDAFIRTRFIQAIKSAEVQHEIIDVKLGYLINPVSNLHVYMGLMNRDSQNSISQWFYIGMQTNIANHYYDF